MDDDRIVRAAQRFLDSITFTLKHVEEELSEKEITEATSDIENNKQSKPENIPAFNANITLILNVETKKRKKGTWNVGVIVQSKDLDTGLQCKRLLFSNQKVIENLGLAVLF